jgi:hypothetical protein
MEDEERSGGRRGEICMEEEGMSGGGRDMNGGEET